MVLKWFSILVEQVQDKSEELRYFIELKKAYSVSQIVYISPDFAF